MRLDLSEKSRDLKKINLTLGGVALICFEVGSSGDGLCEYCDLFKIDWWVSIGPWPILLTFYDCILSRTNCKFIVIENSRVVIYDWSPMGHYCSPI